MVRIYQRQSIHVNAVAEGAVVGGSGWRRHLAALAWSWSKDKTEEKEGLFKRTIANRRPPAATAERVTDNAHVKAAGNLRRKNY
jgi:hypothetical protein